LAETLRRVKLKAHKTMFFNVLSRWEKKGLLVKSARHQTLITEIAPRKSEWSRLGSEIEIVCVE
jgi:hypothetical protein